MTAPIATRPKNPATRADAAVQRGALAMLPLSVGYVPLALVIGAAAADHGAPLAGWTGSWLIFAGSAQLVAIRTMDDAGALLAIFTGLVINARMLVYSAGLAVRWPHQPRWFRIAAAGLINDPTFAVADRDAREHDDPREQRRFFVGAGLTLLACWSVGMGAGAVIGTRLDGIDLGIVAPLCLLAMVGDGLRAGPTRLVVLSAATVALLTTSLPSGTGILVAVAVGTAAGAVADRWRS